MVVVVASRVIALLMQMWKPAKPARYATRLGCKRCIKRVEAGQTPRPRICGWRTAQAEALQLCLLRRP